MKSLPLWSVGPFVLMLLSIAFIPLLAPKFWHPNRNKLLLSMFLGLPVLVALAFSEPGALVHTGREYFSFIVLLGSLFVICGGISVSVDLRATPLVNTSFLALGTVLASFMGTTGAAMLLIRPLLETNRERTRVTHTVIFFMFLVANIGGCLTPLGDPPLFMGYLMGVPFLWCLRLLPAWALTSGILLAIFFLWDRRQYARESAAALAADQAIRWPLRVRGLQNLPLLAGVVLAVGLLTDQIVPFPVREAVLLGLALVSWLLTPRNLRRENRFTFYPIAEVAVLFFGIFATMIPAILILHARGSAIGLAHPMGFFWATGFLSAFLDNTPTYVVFFNLAQATGLPSGAPGVGTTGIAEPILKAISLGAVFLGALTYVGNAPNFMVKAIAEERGVKLPGFLTYLFIATAILAPVFGLVAWVFL